VALTLACTAGIHAAHRVGVLHRDIKPENIMFAGSGALKVTDFGLAKVVGGSLTLATRAGDVLGTPAYIAPEQARGDQVTPATDVYALATMLYEMLSGTLPFRDDGNAMGLLFKHAFEAPIPLADVAPSVPAGLAAVVMKGLATDAADRYDSAESFGLAVAGAATEAWGPGWLAAESVPVMGASAMVSVSERLSPGWAPVPPAPAEDLVTLLPGHPSAPPSTDTASTATASSDTAWSDTGSTGTGSTDTARPPSLEAVSLPSPRPARAPDGSGDTAAAAPGPEPAAGPGLRKILLVAAAIAVGVLLLVLLGPTLFTSYDS
jgi:serine/threonine-protein kinase